MTPSSDRSAEIFTRHRPLFMYAFCRLNSFARITCFFLTLSAMIFTIFTVKGLLFPRGSMLQAQRKTWYTIKIADLLAKYYSQFLVWNSAAITASLFFEKIAIRDLTGYSPGGWIIALFTSTSLRIIRSNLTGCYYAVAITKDLWAYLLSSVKWISLKQKHRKVWWSGMNSTITEKLPFR